MTAEHPDRYAASPAGWLVTAAAVDVVCAGVVATIDGVRAGWIALGVIGGGSIALGLAAVALMVTLDAVRFLRRRRYDLRRDAAFGGRPPGPAELAEDYAAAAVHFPYPTTRED